MFFGIRDPGSGIRDPRSGIRDPGSGIRDGKNPDPGSGIRDKHPGSATLVTKLYVLLNGKCKAGQKIVNLTL